jgi:hypothetical protein
VDEGAVLLMHSLYSCTLLMYSTQAICSSNLLINSVSYNNPWMQEVRTRLEHISQQACCDCGSSPQAIAGRWHQRQWRDVVEDGQEEATEDKEVVLEEDRIGEEADLASPVQWMVPTPGAGERPRARWRGDRRAWEWAGMRSAAGRVTSRLRKGPWDAVGKK